MTQRESEFKYYKYCSLNDMCGFQTKTRCTFKGECEYKVKKSVLTDHDLKEIDEAESAKVRSKTVPNTEIKP